jgi:hypothetical protein
LRVEGFSCSLGVLGISNLQFLIKKIKKTISSCTFFPLFGHQHPGSESGSGSGSALRPGSGSAIRENAGSISGSAKNQCVSTTLLLAIKKIYCSFSVCACIHDWWDVSSMHHSPWGLGHFLGSTRSSPDCLHRLHPN